MCGHDLVHWLPIYLPETSAPICGDCWRARRSPLWFLDQLGVVVELTPDEVLVLQEKGEVFVGSPTLGRRRVLKVRGKT